MNRSPAPEATGGNPSRSRTPAGDSGYFVHPLAALESATIGARTRIWAFAHVLQGAVVGADCNLCDHILIEGDVRIGDRVTIRSFVALCRGVTLEDDVFVGANAVFTNDRYPRSRQWREQPLPTLVKAGASIGVGATILPGLTIGEGAMIGAGAVVTRDVPPHAIVVGNPGRIVGFAGDGLESQTAADSSSEARLDAGHPGLLGVARRELERANDLPGTAVLLAGDTIPFPPARVATVLEMPAGHIHRAHAHRTLEQFFVCLEGDCFIHVDDAAHRCELRLDSPRLGIHVGPWVWAVLSRFSPRAVLLVFESRPHQAGDCLHDYGDFCRAARARRETGEPPGREIVPPQR